MTDTENTKNIICPYCGYEDEDSFELQRDSWNTECISCWKKLFYERYIDVTYTTKKI